jgi:hypothetical protein
MPRIDDLILDCTIYLYPSVADAEDGKSVGGTGFLVGVLSEVHQNYYHVYAVTTSHVIREGMSPVIRLNTKDGSKDVLRRELGDWKHHTEGDDLAICPIDLSERYQYLFIATDLFLDREMVTRYRLGPGEDVFMVGRFVNHEGRQKNLPTVRFGNIAMMPFEPMRTKSGIMQESFLIECRSLGGYSGSPVFVWILPGTHRPWYAGGYSFKGQSLEGPWLLGIDWCHLPNYEPIYQSDKETRVAGNWVARSNTGMAGVIPAWRLFDFLNIGELVVQRRQKDERITREKEGGSS